MVSWIQTGIGYLTQGIKDRFESNSVKRWDVFLRDNSARIEDLARMASTQTTETARLVMQDAVQNLKQMLGVLEEHYKNNLTLTIRESGQLAVQATDCFTRALEDAMSRPSIANMSNHADRFFKEILGRRVPYVGQISPLCIADSKKDYSIQVRVNGIFSLTDLQTSKAEENPILTIGTHEFSCIRDVGNVLVFSIPFSFILKYFKDQDIKGQLVGFTVTIPYAELPPHSIWNMIGFPFSASHALKQLVHKSNFLILPEVAGSGEIVYTDIVEQLETKEFQSNDYHQVTHIRGRYNSTRKSFMVAVESGYKIDKGSAKIHILKKIESVVLNIITEADDRIIVDVTTKNLRSKGPFAEVRFYVTYTATKVIKQIQTIKENMTLYWGTSTQLDADRQLWKIFLKFFDGSSVVIDKEDVGTFSRHPFAKVTSSFASPVLEIAPPEKIDQGLVKQTFIRPMRSAL